MTEEDGQKDAPGERLTAELDESLKRCRMLLQAWRSRMARQLGEGAPSPEGDSRPA